MSILRRVSEFLKAMESSRLLTVREINHEVSLALGRPVDLYLDSADEIQKALWDFEKRKQEVKRETQNNRH